MHWACVLLWKLSAILLKVKLASLRMRDHVKRSPSHPRSLRHMSEDILDHLAPAEAPRPEELPANPQDHDIQYMSVVLGHYTLGVVGYASKAN